MKKCKFTEQKIAFALKQAELGTLVEEVCRKVGISDAIFYNWKKKWPASIKQFDWFFAGLGIANRSISQGQKG